MVFLTYLGYKNIIEPAAELSTQLLKKIQNMAYREVYDLEKIKKLRWRRTSCSTGLEK